MTLPGIGGGSGDFPPIKKGKRILLKVKGCRKRNLSIFGWMGNIDEKVFEFYEEEENLIQEVWRSIYFRIEEIVSIKSVEEGKKAF